VLIPLFPFDLQPWKVQYVNSNKPKSIQSLELKSANSEMHVDLAGVYRLLEVRFSPLSPLLSAYKLTECFAFVHRFKIATAPAQFWRMRAHLPSSTSLSHLLLSQLTPASSQNRRSSGTRYVSA
jgi:hypothetical protein